MRKAILLLVLLISVTSLSVLNLQANGVIVDERDGQSYKTVKIGEQVWMAENLNIGTIISSTQAGYQMSDNDVIEKYCWDNATGNCDGDNSVMKRGGFYEWKEAVQFWDGQPNLPVQGVCPKNWHIPSSAEWNLLFNQFGSASNAAKQLGVGGSSGFNALMTGYRCTMTGGFRPSAMNEDFRTYFIVAEQTDAENIPVLEFSTTNISIPFAYSKSLGFCVRCILDEGQSDDKPSIDVDKNMIDFGKAEMNECLEETIIIANNGNANLDILDLYISGDDKAQFSVPVAMGMTISPGQTKELVISYCPTSLGEHNAILTIKSNSANDNELNIDLSGISEEAEVKLPSISSDITNVDFGEAELEQCLAETITISNTGKAILYISEYIISGEGKNNFAVQTSPEDPIESGEKGEVIITYCPSEEGTHSAVLTIVSNADNNKEFEINLIGTGKDASSINDNNSSNILSFSVSPNPITSTSLINYSINANTSVNIELFVIDILGNKVLELKNELISNGSYTYELNSNNLSSGKYFLIGKVNNNISKLPILIQK